MSIYLRRSYIFSVTHTETQNTNPTAFHSFSSHKSQLKENKGISSFLSLFFFYITKKKNS